MIKSLEPNDDERTGISKKISWILRHGATRVNVKMDQDGWVKVSDLLATEILDDVEEETLMAVIVDSNAQKLRYKLRESPEGQFIKAYSKTERKATTTGGPMPAPPVESEKKGQCTLRQEAQPFVPSSFPPVAGLPQLGYPWPLAGSFGFPPVMPQWPGAYHPMAPFAAMEGTLGGIPSDRYRGRIKSFNVEKGFGFIECAETHAQFDRDVFLHKAQLGDMTAGTEVTFKVETNKQGMPQAKDLAPIGSGTLLASSGKAGRGKGKGGRTKGGGRGQGKAAGGKADRSSKGKEQQEASAAVVSAAVDTDASPSAGPSTAEAAVPLVEAVAPALDKEDAAGAVPPASVSSVANAADAAPASSAAPAAPAASSSPTPSPTGAAEATGGVEAAEATAQEAPAAVPADAAAAAG